MHKLQTQDVQQHDKIPTVVPIHTNETHAWKSGTSKPTLNTHDDSFLLRAAVQNCNGLRREGHKCRLANSMDADKIGVCCLTETHLETMQSERWDTGHTLLTSGMAQRKGRRGSQGVGACLSKKCPRMVRSWWMPVCCNQWTVLLVPALNRHHESMLYRLVRTHLGRSSGHPP